jgi:hypothetical protein
VAADSCEALARTERHCSVGERVHGQHRQPRFRRTAAARHVDAFRTRRGDVEDRNVGLDKRGEAHRGRVVVKSADDPHVGRLLQQPGGSFARQGVVVDDDDADHADTIRRGGRRQFQEL